MKKIQKVTVSSDCIGCGTCGAVCAEVFQVDTVAHVKEGVRVEDHKDCIQEAADMCPAGAIKLTTDDKQE